MLNFIIFERMKNFWLLNKNEKIKNVNIFLYGNDYKIGKVVRGALYIHMLTLLRFTNKMNTPTFVSKILHLTHSDVWPTPAFDPLRRLRLLRLTTPTFDHSEVWDSYVCRGTVYVSDICLYKFVFNLIDKRTISYYHFVYLLFQQTLPILVLVYVMASWLNKRMRAERFFGVSDLSSGSRAVCLLFHHTTIVILPRQKVKSQTIAVSYPKIRKVFF